MVAGSLLPRARFHRVELTGVICTEARFHSVEPVGCLSEAGQLIWIQTDRRSGNVAEAVGWTPTMSFRYDHEHTDHRTHT